MIGRGVAYRKTDETDLLRSKRGSCTSGGVWHTAKWDSTGYCSSPPSTSSSHHRLLFIHRRPPPASTCDCSSTGSCSSSLHHALLHRLLFNHPSAQAPVQPTLHGLLFIHPSTIYYSSSPPRGRPVHPALHRVLFIQPQPALSIGVLFIQRQHHGVLFIHPIGNCSSKPPSNAHYSSRGSVDRLQLAAVAKESLDRVQLTAIDRSLGFSNA